MIAEQLSIGVRTFFRAVIGQPPTQPPPRLAPSLSNVRLPPLVWQRAEVEERAEKARQERRVTERPSEPNEPTDPDEPEIEPEQPSDPTIVEEPKLLTSTSTLTAGFTARNDGEAFRGVCAE